MKKPEPWPVTLRPPGRRRNGARWARGAGCCCGCPAATGHPAPARTLRPQAPQRRKKRSIGEPCGNGDLLLHAHARRIDAHAHRNHRGLHALHDVGKADRALRGLRLLRHVLGLSGAGRSSAPRRRARRTTAAAPSPATVVARRASRRAESTPRGFEVGLTLSVMKSVSILFGCSSRPGRANVVVSFRRRRWGPAPYRGLSAGLKLGKVASFLIDAIISMT